MGVLLTGGSSGIGRAILEDLLGSGIRVTVVSRRDPRVWEPPVSGDRSAFGWLKLDLSDRDSVTRVLEEWLRSNGGSLDSVIHSAVCYGSDGRHPFTEHSAKEFDEVYAVNVYAQFVVTRATVPYLLERPRGCVLGISSDVALLPGPGRVAYASSKAASHSVLAALAMEVAGSNVAVVELAPEGHVDTPGLRRRRPVGFDFSVVGRAGVFGPAVNWILQQGSPDMNGKSFILSRTGELRTADGAVVRSFGGAC